MKPKTSKLAAVLRSAIAVPLWMFVCSANTSSLAAPSVIPPGPKLEPAAQDGYRQQFRQAPQHKAFAVSRDGKAYAAVFGHTQAFEAVRAASVACLVQHKALCQIWLVNEDNNWARYDSARVASHEAVQQLRRLSSPPADPFEVAVNAPPLPVALREGTSMHGMTPLQAPKGAKVIDSAGVVKLLVQARKPVLIDTLHGKNVVRSSLPTAHWLQGAGWEDGALNARIEANFRIAMGQLAPNKSTPVVVYCSNADCWLSWNAALRLVQLGYRDVHWYRGGVEAWKRNRLPLVDTPLSAHLW